MSWGLLLHNTPLTPDVFELTINPNGLDSVIRGMAPEVYFKFDDLPDSTTVADLGSAGYVNSVLTAGAGSAAFQQAPIMPDGGYGLAVDGVVAGDKAGVTCQDVPATSAFNAAYMFVYNMAAPTSFGTVMEYGDAISMFLDLGGTITLDVGGESHTTTNADFDFITGAPQLLLIDLVEEPDGTIRAGIYTEDGLAETITGITKPEVGEVADLKWFYSTAAATHDTTFDYTALIPHANLDPFQIIDAFLDVFSGAILKSPSVVTAAPEPEGLIFHSHFDTISAQRPIRTGTGIEYVYDLVNEANNNYTLSTDVDIGRVIPGGVFGSNCLKADKVGGREYDYSPITTGFWREGSDSDYFGIQPFSYDVRVWAEWDSGLCYAGGNQALFNQGGSYYRYGGMTIRLRPQSKERRDLGRIEVIIGATLADSLAGTPDALVVSCRNIPGYVYKGWNHIHVGREISFDGKQEWFIHLNGRRAPVTRQSQKIKGTKKLVDIQQAGPWTFGSFPKIKRGDPRYASRYTPPARFDEARMIIGECVYKNDFTPPGVPYEYV